MVAPFILGAALNAASSIAKPSQGSTVKDPGMINGVTRGDRQQGIDYGSNLYGDELGFGASTAKGSGVSIKGSKEDQAGKQQKAQAALDYLMNVKGLSQQEAQSKVNQILSNPNKQFNDLAGFSKWIKSGEGTNYNLKVTKEGKIKSTDPYAGPEYTESQPDMRDALNQTNMTSLDMINQLMPWLSQDLGDATAFKSGVRGMMYDDLSQQNIEGLNPDQIAALEARKNAALRDYQGTFNDNVKNVIGRLQGSGALRSSLIGQSLNRGAFAAYGKFLQGLNSDLAGQEQQYMNDAAQRGAIRINNLTNAFGAGGAGSLQNLANPYMNPANIGLATDPQQAQILLQKQALEQEGRLGAGKLLMGAYLQPTLNPNSAPTGGGWGSLIGGGLGAALGGAVGMPGLGAMAGSAIGGRF